MSNTGGMRNNGSGGGTMVSALNLDEGEGDSAAASVRVVADEENNSLMIYSTGMQYKTIKAALEKLDTRPRRC